MSAATTPRRAPLLERDMPKYLVLSPLRYNGITYPRDVAVEIDDTDAGLAAQLTARGTIRPLVDVPVYVPTSDEIEAAARRQAAMVQPEELRQDGPTFEEHVDAGKDATAYPEPGFAPRDTPAWRVYQASLQPQQPKRREFVQSPPAARQWSFTPSIRPMKGR